MLTQSAIDFHSSDKALSSASDFTFLLSTRISSISAVSAPAGNFSSTCFWATAETCKSDNGASLSVVCCSTLSRHAKRKERQFLIIFIHFGTTRGGLVRCMLTVIIWINRLMPQIVKTMVRNIAAKWIYKMLINSITHKVLCFQLWLNANVENPNFAYKYIILLGSATSETIISW